MQALSNDYGSNPYVSQKTNQKMENYKWMVPTEFNKDGYYYKSKQIVL
jgi:hypothetical protein